MNTALAIRTTRLIPSLFPLEYMVEEAIAFLREHEPPVRPFQLFVGRRGAQTPHRAAYKRRPRPPDC